MARNWQYPRWRRLLMQAAMWGILGLTVGGAALLDRHIHTEHAAVMGDLITCGSIRLQMPRGWTVEESARQPGLLTATTTVQGQAIRNLYITVAAADRDGLIPKLMSRRDPNLREDGIPFGHGGSTGTLFTWTGSLSENYAQIPFVQVIATATMKDGPAVTIRLEQIGSAGDVASMADTAADLVKQIAATIVPMDQTTTNAL